MNGKRVDIPSYTVRIGNVITIKTKKEPMLKALKERRESLTDRLIPKWLEVDKEEFKAKVVDVPKKEDIGFPIQEQLIVELYSK